jgi:uncharacterized protein with PIN domain
MPANRCARCMRNWPLRPEYERCPTCSGPTLRNHFQEAMPLEVARTHLHRAFERFYAERERRREPQMQRAVEA